MSHSPRIAILGFSLESNRNAPVSDRLIFEQTLYVQGDELGQKIADDRAGLPGTVQGFCAQMDQQTDWTPIPILLAEAPPGGPAEQVFFDDMVKSMRSGLQQAGALDGVYVSEHGAGLATELDDADGEVFAMVRDVVGPDVPVIATLDLHGHVTPRMNEAVDVMVAYLTNPHVDQRERGSEAADIMIEMFNGMKPHSALVKVPMISPPVTLLTAKGPYADLINFGQTQMNSSIVNISILAGFAPADASTNGLSVVVSARDKADTAMALAQKLADRAWSERHRYIATLTSLEDAISRAQDVQNNPKLPAILLADVADNPGGGGRGNTMYLLQALLDAKVEGVVVGMVFDPALADEAHALGEGAEFTAMFNRDETTTYSDKLSANARVERLVDGSCIGRRGIYAQRRVQLGQGALLKIDGIQVAVVSRRHQCADPVFLERLGIDLATVRILMIKSRGHFRAGFDEHFSPEQIVEVDAPGLTTPVITKLNLSRVPRPVFPLDQDMSWSSV